MNKKDPKQLNQENNIYTKLQKIQSEIKELIRTEENKFQKYFFFNELQILQLLKPLLKNYNLVILLSDDTNQPFIHERNNLCTNCSLAVGEKSGKEHFIKYLKRLEIIDTEVPENRLLFNFWACGSNVDLAKAKGSTETYAIKYMLSKFFLIPVKDEADPDYKEEKKDVITPEERKTISAFLKKQQDNKLDLTTNKTITPEQVQEIYDLFVSKRGTDLSIQTNFLKEVDKIMVKYGMVGTTNTGNFRIRLATLTPADYQTLMNYLNNLPDSK